MSNLQTRLEKQQEKIKKETDRLKQLLAQQTKKKQAQKYRDSVNERKAIAHLKHTLGGMVYKMGLGGLDEALFLGLLKKNYDSLSITTADNLELLKIKGKDYLEKGKTLPAVKLAQASQVAS